MLLDNAVRDSVRAQCEALEQHLKGDVAFYYGSIDSGALKIFRDFIEKMSLASTYKPKSLFFFLNSPGGSAEVAEKMVEIMRHHYSEISFVVPDMAFSAGTILCMSGDQIYMDYSSALGPIDPQVWNGKDWVPALGYLDKVEQLLEKARQNQLSNAEFLILQNQDLALLSRYEQAKDLTVTLLKKWLVQYKFRDWLTHGSDPRKIGLPVTAQEKEDRAKEIARDLGDNKMWHSHGRMIGPGTLNSKLRLRINDYSDDTILRPMIRAYNDLLTEYIARQGFKLFLHSRDYF